MADRYLVQIDIEKLRANVSKADGTRGLSTFALENASEAFIDKPHLGTFVDSKRRKRL